MTVMDDHGKPVFTGRHPPAVVDVALVEGRRGLDAEPAVDIDLHWPRWALIPDQPCGGDTFRPCRRPPRPIHRPPPGSLRRCSSTPVRPGTGRHARSPR